MKFFSLVVLLVSSLIASNAYVGIDAGSTRISIDQGSTHLKTTNSGSQTAKVGYYLNENNRIAIFYQHINISDGNGNSYGANYDYLFLINEKIKLFIGASAGYTKLSDGVEGLIYGGESGLTYEINENFSLEAGYRVYKTNVEYSHTNIKIDNMQNWFAGINYKFN